MPKAKSIIVKTDVESFVLLHYLFLFLGRGEWKRKNNESIIKKREPENLSPEHFSRIIICFFSHKKVLKQLYDNKDDTDRKRHSANLFSNQVRWVWFDVG